MKNSPIQFSLMIDFLLSVGLLLDHPTRHIVVINVVPLTGPGLSSQLVFSLPVWVWKHLECTSHITYYHRSSVGGGGARDPRYFRFALRSPDGAISGQKRVFLGSFWGFSAPRQAGRLGEGRKTRWRPKQSQVLCSHI